MVENMMLHLHIVCLFAWINTIWGQTLTDTKQLYTDVFANLQKEVVPNLDQSQPLNVSVRFFLINIAKFDETQETIIIIGSAKMTWTDGGISWNPASYGNKQSIPISSKNIWTPSLILTNAINALEPIDQATDFNVNIFYNGTVSLSSGGVLAAKCTVDISKFPFDSQTCTLQFTIWNTFASDVMLNTVASDPVSLDFYTEHSDWSLQSHSAKSYLWNNFSIYDVTFTIKRHSLYYSIIVICPTMLFVALNPLVFLLPVESGERIGLSMTVLLSYAIFLTLVSDAIPASSNPMSITLIVMMITITISSIIVFMNIIILTLYYRENNTQMNTFWRFIGTRLPWSRHDNIVMPLQDEKPGPSSSWKEREVTWKDVTDGLDILCLFVSYVLILIIGIFKLSLMMS